VRVLDDLRVEQRIAHGIRQRAPPGRLIEFSYTLLKFDEGSRRDVPR